jgi:hypothetical protein
MPSGVPGADTTGLLDGLELHLAEFGIHIGDDRR